MAKIVINGHEYTLTIDKFGIRYIDGVLITDWLKTADTGTLLYLARKGMNVAKSEPEHFDDIVERYEIPTEEADLMKRFVGRDPL